MEDPFDTVELIGDAKDTLAQETAAASERFAEDLYRMPPVQKTASSVRDIELEVPPFLDDGGPKDKVLDEWLENWLAMFNRNPRIHFELNPRPGA